MTVTFAAILSLQLLGSEKERQLLGWAKKSYYESSCLWSQLGSTYGRQPFHWVGIGAPAGCEVGAGGQRLNAGHGVRRGQVGPLGSGGGRWGSGNSNPGLTKKSLLWLYRSELIWATKRMQKKGEMKKETRMLGVTVRKSEDKDKQWQTRSASILLELAFRFDSLRVFVSSCK